MSRVIEVYENLMVEVYEYLNGLSQQLIIFSGLEKIPTV